MTDVKARAAARHGQGNRMLIGQDLEEVSVVPAGLLAPGGNAALGRGLAAQEVEGHTPQDRQHERISTKDGVLPCQDHPMFL